ncbi:hypothetical protein C0J52_28004, partial [Blattella germanica]
MGHFSQLNTHIGSAEQAGHQEQATRSAYWCGSTNDGRTGPGASAARSTADNRATMESLPLTLDRTNLLPPNTRPLTQQDSAWLHVTIYRYSAKGRRHILRLLKSEAFPVTPAHGINDQSKLITITFPTQEEKSHFLDLLQHDQLGKHAI